jgi:hypothetical protein
MRRRCFCSIAVVALAACLPRPALATRVDPSSQDRQQREQELRRTIADLLDGCIAIVRVYPDAANAPTYFEKVRVAITVRPIERRGGRRAVTVRHKNVKAAYPTITTAACVVFFGPDQTDEAVTTVLARCAYTSAYREDGYLSLSLGLEAVPYEPWWTFVDALGDPIAGATVRIEHTIMHPSGVLYLGEETLDRQGRLQRLRSSESLIFTVTHPDYGSARMRCLPFTRAPSGICVVPLVPLDAPEISSSIQGTVVDSESRPVPGVMVRCAELQDADGLPLNYDRRYSSRAVTDDQGSFSLCVPLVTEDDVLEGLPPAGARYKVEVQPPRQSHLRQLGKPIPLSVLAGTRVTFTLTLMEAEKTFHTFAFEYYEGPVTDPQELGNITLTLMRDDRPSVHLTYDQFKSGYALPPGILRAATTRWRQSFGFQEIELTPDSPEHLVIRSREPVFYRGRIVDGATEAPMPDVLVLADHSLARTDPCAFTETQWQQLRAQAVRETVNRSPEVLYRMRDRVTMTDAEGFYQLTFMPGFNRTLNTFVAKAPGHPSASVSATYRDPGADGFTDLGTIMLSPPDKPLFMPTFVFESEAGPVTDPNALAEIRIKIRNRIGSGTREYGIDNLSTYIEKGPFYAGVYFAEAVWNRKRYTFEPVDLTGACPDTVVFKPQEIWHASVIYQGQVIHGITGRPMPKAIVIYCPHATRDASGLEPGHWTTIKSLGPDPDPTDLALAPLWAKLFDQPLKHTGSCALTDANGWFRIQIEHQAMKSLNSLLILDEHFLGAGQALQLYTGRGNSSNRGLPYEPLVPDENGLVMLEPSKLFPAGTLVIHPVIPDPGGRRRRELLSLLRRIPDGARPSWLDSRVSRQVSLQPNVSQTVYILAGVDQEFTLYHASVSPPPPLLLGRMGFQQGQVIDLGRVEFDQSVEVLVRVVDPRGDPVSGLRIVRVDQNETGYRMPRPTDIDGQVPVKVTVHSTGRFCVVHVNPETRERFEECAPFEVRGGEDAGRKFTLQLSDEMLRRVLPPER